ncbi:MAG: NAD(P)H-binding protein [bacterium]|nr:NAD(P)H-binding protein [bacterium]
MNINNGNERDSRYSRQTILHNIGTLGQETFLKSKVLIIGCGALGTHIAGNLARAGIGTLHLVDRDLVELNNLQRQSLFDENDLGQPKAAVAAAKLKKINSDIHITHLIKDVNNTNIEEMVEGFHLVLDGTDNIPTRMLINDVCVKNRIPWIYTGVIRTRGMVMPVLPGGPCLGCLLPAPPAPGSNPTCATAGGLNTIPPIIAAVECTEAYKILLGEKSPHRLISYDVWEHHFNHINMEKDEDCVCCGKRDFKYLNTKQKEIITNMCGNGVQIIPPKGTLPDLAKVTANLEKSAQSVMATEFLVKFEAEGKRVTLFSDGRAIIKGVGDKGAAKAFYSRYVGL